MLFYVAPTTFLPDRTDRVNVLATEALKKSVSAVIVLWCGFLCARPIGKEWMKCAMRPPPPPYFFFECSRKMVRVFNFIWLLSCVLVSL